MTSPSLPQQPASILATRQGRQRLVLTAMRLSENTAIEPQEYEKELLDRFIAGDMTIEQVMDRLDEPREA